MDVLLSPRVFRLGRYLMMAWGVFFYLPVIVLFTYPATTTERILWTAYCVVSSLVWAWFAWFVMGRANWRTGIAAVALITAIVAVIAIQTPPAFGTFFIFATVAAGTVLPWRPALGVIATITLLAAGIDIARGSGVPQIVSSLFDNFLCGVVGIAGRQLVSAYLQLAAARSEIARLAVDEERLRFARDLHDLLGHSLSVIAMKSELAGRLLGRTPGLAEHEVADIERVAREALREVRDAVAGYRQPTLATELAGAKAALSAGNVALVVDAPSTPIPPAVEAVLAWAVREGATNVLRHSGATRCAIRVGHDDGMVTVEVVDNGPPTPISGSGSGLPGLQERVDARGGQMEAGPLPHEGYRLRVTLPLRQAPVAEAAEITSRSA